MKIEWEKKSDDLHTGKTDKVFEALVTQSDDEWLATVTLVSRDGSAEVDYDQALRPTLEEAKQAAQASVDYALRPFVETAVIAEREACAQIALDLADDYETRAGLPHARGSLWGHRMTQACVASEVADAIRDRGAEDSEP